MVGWHHQLNGHEFEQTLGDSEGQRSLLCCNPWGRRVRHHLAAEQQQNSGYNSLRCKKHPCCSSLLHACVCVCQSLRHVQLFVTPCAEACQAPLSMGFSRQEYWSGFPFPSPGDIPYPGSEPRSPALQADSSLSEPLGK